MLRLVLLTSIIGFSYSNAQTQFFEPSETVNKNRVIGTSAGIGVSWAGSLIGLHQVWYADSWGDGFRSFDDSHQWLQMDKAGHFFTGQLIAQHTSALYRWSGLGKTRSRLIGSLVSFGYLSSFELMDGRAEEWGFSWSDLGANALGVGWFYWQDALWDEQRIQLKFSAQLSPYAQYRPNILGSSFAERLLKDYNGQTYWLSVAPASFFKEKSRFPKWLSLAFGYSATEKLVGDENEYIYTASNGEITTFNARRQYLFSLDVDLTKINVEKAWLRSLFKLLNHIKIPFSTLEFSGGAWKGHWVYF